MMAGILVWEWRLLLIQTSKTNEAVANLFSDQMVAGSHGVNASAGGRKMYRNQLLEVFVGAERVLEDVEHLKQYAFLFAFSTVFSLFKSFRANPKLNMALLTLRKGFADMSHYLVIFAAIVGGYFTLTGMVVFGHRVHAFNNVTSVFDAVVKLATGRFLFDAVRSDMADVYENAYSPGGNSFNSGPEFELGGIGGLALGRIWVYLFFLIVVLLLINLLVMHQKNQFGMHS